MVQLLALLMILISLDSLTNLFSFIALLSFPLYCRRAVSFLGPIRYHFQTFPPCPPSQLVNCALFGGLTLSPTPVVRCWLLFHGCLWCRSCI